MYITDKNAKKRLKRNNWGQSSSSRVTSQARNVKILLRRVARIQRQ